MTTIAITSDLAPLPGQTIDNTSRQSAAYREALATVRRLLSDAEVNDLVWELQTILQDKDQSWVRPSWTPQNDEIPW